MKKLLMGLLFVANCLWAQTMMTKVIQLNYVPADKMIQLIQPLLQPDEKVSGSGQTLIVKVSPDTLTQIREIVHKVDAPPVTFNVVIYQGDPNWLSPQNNNTVSNSTRSQAEELRSQSVNVMSGQSALISMDQQVPIVTAVGAGFFNAGVSYEQHDVNNGLLVEPVLKGSQVQLSVKRLRQQVNPAGGQQFDNQQVNTTVMVPIGKWVSLGSAQGAQYTTDSSSTSYGAGRNFTRYSTLYIKVSVINAVPTGDTK